MVTPAQIEQLIAFEASDARVLSMYLDVTPERRLQGAHRVAFKDLVKDVRHGLDKPARKELSREAARAGAWLEDAELLGRGVALFSCLPGDLWQTFFLPDGIRDHLAFEPRPNVAPLLEILDEYERYAVALVDKEKARFFTVFMGEIEEAHAFRDFVPGKHDQGGPAQARFQRHHETHVLWHLKRVVERLAELVRGRGFDRLILAGPNEATSALRRLLPHEVAQRLAALIPAEVSAGEAEILEKTLEVERGVERAAEEQLMQELFDAAGVGRGARGLAPTLEALWLNDVSMLLVAPDLHGAGSECPTCRRLEEGTVATCPACGAPMQPVHDIVERAMERAVEQGGAVEVVHGAAAERLTKAGQGIGALLRF